MFLTSKLRVAGSILFNSCRSTTLQPYRLPIGYRRTWPTSSSMLGLNACGRCSIVDLLGKNAAARVGL